MRHVSRIHRVALDWLFDRINLDSKIQIKYIDTKNQFADILTKGNFTRDKWNHLLNLFDKGHFSSTVCTVAMAKRVQQGSGEESVTAKVKTYDEFDREDAVDRVGFNFIKLGGGLRTDIKILGNLLQVTIDRGNLRKLLGIHCKKLTFIVKNLFSAEIRIP